MVEFQNIITVTELVLLLKLTKASLPCQKIINRVTAGILRPKWNGCAVKLSKQAVMYGLTRSERDLLFAVKISLVQL